MQRSYFKIFFPFLPAFPSLSLHLPQNDLHIKSPHHQPSRMPSSSSPSLFPKQHHLHHNTHKHTKAVIYFQARASGTANMSRACTRTHTHTHTPLGPIDPLLPGTPSCPGSPGGPAGPLAPSTPLNPGRPGCKNEINSCFTSPHPHPLEQQRQSVCFLARSWLWKRGDAV